MLVDILRQGGWNTLCISMEGHAKNFADLEQALIYLCQGWVFNNATGVRRVPFFKGTPHEPAGIVTQQELPRTLDITFVKGLSLHTHLSLISGTQQNNSNNNCSAHYFNSKILVPVRGVL